MAPVQRLLLSFWCHQGWPSQSGCGDDSLETLEVVLEPGNDVRPVSFLSWIAVRGHAVNALDSTVGGEYKGGRPVVVVDVEGEEDGARLTNAQITDK